MTTNCDKDWDEAVESCIEVPRDLDCAVLQNALDHGIVDF